MGVGDMHRTDQTEALVAEKDAEQKAEAEDVCWYADLRKANTSIAERDAEIERLRAANKDILEWQKSAEDEIAELSKRIGDLDDALIKANTEITLLRSAFIELREVLDPDDWMGEVSMHQFIDDTLGLKGDLP